MYSDISLWKCDKNCLFYRILILCINFSRLFVTTFCLVVPFDFVPCTLAELLRVGRSLRLLSRALQKRRLAGTTTTFYRGIPCSRPERTDTGETFVGEIFVYNNEKQTKAYMYYLYFYCCLLFRIPFSNEFYLYLITFIIINPLRNLFTCFLAM